MERGARNVLDCRKLKGKQRHSLNFKLTGFLTREPTLKAGLGMRLWKSSQGEDMFTGMAHFLFSGKFSFDFSSFPFSLGVEDDTAS